MIWIALAVVWIVAMLFVLALVKVAAPSTPEERAAEDEAQMRALLEAAGDPLARMPGWEEHA